MNTLHETVSNLPAMPTSNSHGLRLVDLMQDESGQDLIEYALIAALIGIGAVISLRGLSTKIASAFTSIGTTLTSAT